MKKVFAVIMMLTVMLLADAPRNDNREKPLFMQGKIKIQLTETAHNSGMLKIDNASKAYSITGFKSLDELNMKYSSTQMKNPFMAAKNKEMEKSLGLDRWLIMDIPEETDVMSAVADYKKDPNVEFACPEYLIYTTAAPSDPMYASQWGHNNTAQMLAWKTGDTYNHTGTAVGTVGFDARAQLGWDGSQGYGSSTVIIGIIDSGVDTAHEDINDVAGYDFGDNDTNPMDNSSAAGHGTCCAGVAAGIVNNGKGVAGVAGNCKIMPLKIANSAGSMTFTAITNAVNWGADNGAHVLSMSLGANVSPGYDTACDAAMVYAYNSGVVLLAATANNNATNIYYPSNHANVVGVGAASNSSGRKRSSSKTTEVNSGNFTDPNGVTVDNEIWWGSNYGVATKDAANAVDFLAPCILPTTDITGTAGYQSGNYYTYFNGTSSACPYAAGFAALIVSRYPTYTPAQVISLMKSTCTDIVNVESVAGWDKYSGYGLINIGAALGSAGTPPPTPTLLLPANASSTSDLTPTFDWSDATGATSYTIQIDNTSNFSSPEYTNSPTVSTYTPGTNLATGTWYWRVLATNSYGSSSYTSGWSVILGNAPAVPTLALPANGSSTTDQTPTFDWNDVSGATSYTIQVDNNSDFSSPEVTNSPTASTFTPGTNLAYGTYYWRVLATNAFGSSAYTSSWSVIIGTVPAAPTLVSPANGSNTSDLTPTFDWSDVAGATSYTIQVDNNSNFSSPEIQQSPTVSTYTPGTNLAVGTYYWRVLTTNTFGSSAYTSSWTVNIGNAPAVPTLLLPANASLTTDQTPTFDWSDVSGATSYTIQVDNNSDFSSPEVSQSPTVSTYTPGTNLAYATYYWRVLATNAYGSSAYTASWTVEIGTVPAAPTLLLPGDLSSTMDQTPSFDWSDVSLATSYTILVDNNSNFSSPEITQSPTVSAYTPAANLANGTYYWKVLSTNAFGSSSYSPTWSFTIAIPNITLSTAQINATAAPEGTDTDSFNIGNTGDAALDYTITKQYIAKKADITVESNDFESGLGYTNSGAVIWTVSSGMTVNCAKATGNSNGLALAILTSDVFDGTACTELTLSFDQIISQNSSRAATFVVEYFNGSAWVEIYNETASTTASQSLPLPVLATNMQIRFTANISSKTAIDTWSIDNVVVSGPEAVTFTWLTINSPLTGSVSASGSNTINLTCDAAGLAEGTYNANITVASNDPDEPSKVLPVEFVVVVSTVIPGVPSNVVTSISGTDLVIDWDVAADATSYDVYSSDDPYGTFIFEANVGTNQYVTPYADAKKFWYIVSKNETK